jgi:phosphate transport system substrate-binding protein
MKVIGNRGLIPLLGASLLLSCSAPPEESSAPSGSSQALITIDGSSTVHPLSSEVVEELKFERGTDAPEISVEFSGTGGGFRKFCANQTDINGASRPISQDEIGLCVENGVEYIELPIAFDALTVVVHEDNDWADDITIEELKTVWEPEAEGKITRWNQVRADWPDRPLKLYGADIDSGTYDYFAEAIVGNPAETRQDYTAESDDYRIVRGVRSDPDALGFFGFAYYQESQGTLKALAINYGDGAVEPSDETVRSGEYRPLTRPLFLYVSKERLETNPELQEFVVYYLANAPFLARTVGYTPLPPEAYAAISDRYEQRVVGTVFEGAAPTDLTLEALTNLEQ